MALKEMTLAEAQEVIERVAENPEGAAVIDTRQIAEALCRLIVSNGLLAFSPPSE